MVAVPSFTAVTVPSAATVATESSLLLHCTVFTVASSGLTVAVSLAVPPTASSMDDKSSVTLSAVISAFCTVTVQVAVLLPHLAVMVAVPSCRAVSFPFSTFTVDGLLLDQVTACSVAFSG